MRPIDADKLITDLKMYYTKMYRVESKTQHNVSLNIINAIDIGSLMKVIENQETVYKDEVVDKLEKDKKILETSYSQLVDNMKNKCISKGILLDDMREIIDGLNDNNLHMTNDQLYDVLKREIEEPLYERPSIGDKD